MTHPVSHAAHYSTSNLYFHFCSLFWRAGQRDAVPKRDEASLRWLSWCLSFQHSIEQLADKSKRIDLVIVFAGGKMEQLENQCITPGKSA
jgi:hypothetical protein